MKDKSGLFTRQGVDFSNTGFKSSLRIRGFFGRVERDYTQTNLVSGDYENSTINTRIDRVYTLQANQLPECIAEYLMEFLIVGTVVRVSDYNKNNHSYHIIRKEVVLEENSGTDYSELTRKATFNLSFSERDKDNRILNCG